MSEGRELLLPLPLGAPAVLMEAVHATVTSAKTRVAYETALADFFAWVAERREPLLKLLVEAWRAAFARPRFVGSSVNQRLSAVRLLVRHAADHGAFSFEEASRLLSVANVKQGG